jgi:hypothetical protein
VSTVSSINVQEQLSLRIDQGISYQLDDIVGKVERIAKKFEIQTVKEKSPIKNVVTAATEPITSLEVIKNFIRYQVGRKNASKIWKLESKESENKVSLFADAVVRDLNSLSNNCKTIIDSIEVSISKGLEDGNLSDFEKDRLKTLKEHLQTNKSIVIQSLHLRLARLYLGYLSREHTALTRNS